MNKQELDILNILFLEPFINQRILSEASGHSLGVVNKSIKTLIKEGFLDDTIRFTKKASQEFQSKAPKNAIILAAGFGMRMIPINTKIPKALLEVNGEPLIEPEILSAILRSDFVYGQIMSCVTGIGRPRISSKDLRKIMIPLPDKQLQAKVMQNLRANEAAVKQLKDRAKALKEEAENLEIRMINEVALTMAGGN